MRIRTVKPEFFTHPEIVVLSPWARILLLSLLTQADDEGRLYDQPRKIGGCAFGDEDDADVRVVLGELAAEGRILRYEAQARKCIQVINFRKHQAISKPRPSTIPPPRPEDYRRATGALPEESRTPPVGNGREPGTGTLEPENGSDSDNSSNVGDTHRVGDSLAPALVDDSEAHRLCDLLADLIENNGSKRPRVTQKWLREARLLLDRDERPIAEAEDLLRWSQEDDFWKGNILSMPKFRVKYDQLRLQASRNGQPTHLADRLMRSAIEEHEGKENDGQARGESPRSPTPRSLPG